MSLSQINRSADLTALLDDGFQVSIQSGHLVVDNVPYVNAQKEVRRGALVSALEMAGNVTVKPTNHVVMFTGEQPCDQDGRELGNLKHSTQRQEIATGLVVERSFSSKPGEGYSDYHHKMVTYAEMLSSHARALEPGATARTYSVVETDDPEEVFNYYDTASGRAGISAVSRKLELSSIGIVGLGGSGSYTLDYVAKTPVREIHIFDGDEFLQHNAFRAPGAATSEELNARQMKVNYFADRYSALRKGIIAHPTYVDESNLGLLQGLEFVFLCIDSGEAKTIIAEKLESEGIPFIDVGMGIELVDEKLLGVMRVTTSVEGRRDHFWGPATYQGDGDDDVYAQNIQIVELNALNAALAVIKWKKIFGFYCDLENEHSSYYTLDGNTILNEDQK